MIETWEHRLHQLWRAGKISGLEYARRAAKGAPRTGRRKKNRIRGEASSHGGRPFAQAGLPSLGKKR